MSKGPRDWGDRLVCYVCQLRHMNPDDCRPVNVIMNGYGVCLDDQRVIEEADFNTRVKNGVINQRRIEVDAALHLPTSVDGS